MSKLIKDFDASRYDHMDSVVSMNKWRSILAALDGFIGVVLIIYALFYQNGGLIYLLIFHAVSPLLQAIILLSSFGLMVSTLVYHKPIRFFNIVDSWPSALFQAIICWLLLPCAYSSLPGFSSMPKLFILAIIVWTVGDLIDSLIFQRKV